MIPKSINKKMQRAWEMAYLDRIKNTKPLTPAEIKEGEVCIKEVLTYIKKIRRD